MKLRIDRNHMSQPPGGWGFAVENGPTLKDEKLEGLLTKIKDHRLANGLPVGDPEHDVAAKYAAMYPWLISKQEAEEGETNDAEIWIHRVWRSYPIQMAEQRTRDERFEQCEKCIHFEPLLKDDLTTEAQRRLILMNPAKTRVENGWCLLRGWIPSIAVQINDPWKFADWSLKKPECWLDQNKPTTEPII